MSTITLILKKVVAGGSIVIHPPLPHSTIAKVALAVTSLSAILLLCLFTRWRTYANRIHGDYDIIMDNVRQAKVNSDSFCSRRLISSTTLQSVRALSKACKSLPLMIEDAEGTSGLVDQELLYRKRKNILMLVVDLERAVRADLELVDNLTHHNSDAIKEWEHTVVDLLQEAAQAGARPMPVPVVERLIRKLDAAVELEDSNRRLLEQLKELRCAETSHEPGK